MRGDRFLLHLARIRQLDRDLVRIESAEADFRLVSGRILGLLTDDRYCTNPDAARYAVAVILATLSQCGDNVREARSAAVAIANDDFNGSGAANDAS